MKKAVPILLLVAIFVAALVLWRKQGGLTLPRPSLATLAPPDAMAFLQISNLARTQERWKGTALAQIAEEPQVKAFLEKPLAKLPKDEVFLDRWNKIDPRGGFIAVARVENNEPIVTLGIEYAGDRPEAEKALIDLKAKLKDAQPNGKADLVKHGDVVIETYANGNSVIATTMVKDWMLASTQVAELEATLERMERKTTLPTLEGSDAFKKSISHLPSEPDLLLYVAPKELISRLKGLMAATGQPVDSASFEKLDKIRSVGGAMKIDGASLREAWYLDQPGVPMPTTLQQHALALTSPATLLFFTTSLQFPDHLTLGDASADITGLTKMLAGLEGQLAAQGVQPEALVKAIGPEAGLSVDWAEGAPAPTGVVSLDIQDRATVQKALAAMTNRPDAAPWAKQTVNGTDYYGMPALGIAAIRPTLALTDHYLIGGINYEEVRKAVDDAGKASGKLSDVPAFQSAKKEVSEAGSGLGYIDTAKIFQNVYSQARPMLMLYASFSKELSDYADASKLPEAAVIAKHLTPIIYSSGKTSDGGFLAESVGPVTASQSVIVLGATAGIVAAPFLKNYLPNLNMGGQGGVSNPTPTVPTPAPDLMPAPGSSSPAPPEAPREMPEPATTPQENRPAPSASASEN